MLAFHFSNAKSLVARDREWSQSIKVSTSLSAILRCAPDRRQNNATASATRIATLTIATKIKFSGRRISGGKWGLEDGIFDRLCTSLADGCASRASAFEELNRRENNNCPRGGEISELLARDKVVASARLWELAKFSVTAG